MVLKDREMKGIQESRSEVVPAQRPEVCGPAARSED